VSIDLVRGVVMVLMLLDHARDFFAQVSVSPTDLARTTVPLFLTRWVTHFCAPAFVFLAGTAAFLHGLRHQGEGLWRFLLLRGLWLILLELTLLRFTWLPDLGYHFVILEVIWALGCSMVVLAALSLLPRPWGVPVIAAIGAVMVGGHNLLDRIAPGDLGALAPLGTILHRPGPIVLGPGHLVLVAYPLVPWIGVMALGYAFGALAARPARQRRRLMIGLGLAAVAGFVVLRAVNVYGDPRSWSSQPRGAVFTALSFVNCQKYPPSLLFLLMTLGPLVLSLGLLDGIAGLSQARALRPLVVFGRVPFFFYVTHLFLLRVVSAPMALARWGPARAFQLPPDHAGSPEFPLWAAYLAWGAALLVLYPLCRWFAALKARRGDRWLSYL
jgi:uncharacterized membrane protein